MISSDNFDTEASVIESARKDPNGFVLAKNRPSYPRQDDTTSMISMDSNISGFSRKSGVSLINMDSILSMGTGASGISRKLPGVKGLRANAERRM